MTNNGNGTFTDTLGVTALKVSGTGTQSSPLAFTYPVTLQADSATSATATMSYKSYTVRTNFQCSGIVEYGSHTVNLVDRITLADGTFYNFTYESTPQATDGAVTARLASMTLPAGGTITYQYTGGCNGTGINPDGTTAGLTRITTDGSKTYARATVNANATSTTVTDEKSNVSIYQFTEDSAKSQFYETHRTIYQGSATGTPLLEQTTCYNGSVTPCDGTSLTLPITNIVTVASYNGGRQATTSNTYSSAGLLTGSTVASGGTTLTALYANYNAFAEPLTQRTADGSNNTVSSITYSYDETTGTGHAAVQATSGIPQHTAPAAGTATGKLTSSSVSTSTGSLTSAFAYYDTGMPVSSTAPDGGTTTFGYDATQTFATTTTLPTPSSGVALGTSATYDTQSAMPISITGMNAGQTSTVVNYDRLLRPLSISFPDGGTSSFSYSSNQSGAAQTLRSGVSADTETLYDGYGRVSRVAVLNGQSANPWYQTDYCYDAAGLLSFQSTSYQGTGWGTPKQCSGAGVLYFYDALGRPISSQTVDGSATVQYTNRAVLTKDVNGIQRITQYDLLGRIAAVCEISANTYYSASP